MNRLEDEELDSSNTITHLRSDHNLERCSHTHTDMKHTHTLQRQTPHVQTTETSINHRDYTEYAAHKTRLELIEKHCWDLFHFSGRVRYMGTSHRRLF